MRLNVLNSDSSGNGYILQNEHEALVLECGCSLSSLQKAVDFNTAKINGCLITHEHGDHSKYASKYIGYMPLYASNGTASAINDKINHHSKVKVLEPLKWHSLGRFKVMPFATQHDCAEPYGYLIAHPEIGKVVFATDTYYLRYKFDGLTNVMIECNYDTQILQDNVDKGIIHPLVQRRTHESHMSLDTCLNTLKANDLTNVSQIVLLHLSNKNADGERFQKIVQQETGKITHIAKKGLEIEFNKTPFL